MTRKKTNPFVARHLLAKIEKVNMKEEKEIIVTWSRASSILPAMVGHTILIHNRKVTNHMVDEVFLAFGVAGLPLGGPRDGLLAQW